MNALPIRIPTTALDELDRIEALFARGTEALRRTNAIVDRLCPMPFLPNVSSLYPELNGSQAAWRNFNDAASRRKALYRAIKPRIEAKCAAQSRGDAA